MRASKKWTARGDATLKAYWNNDYPAPKIAKIMRRSPASIYLRAKRIGLKRRLVKLSREQRDEAWATVEKLAEKLGCSPHNIVNQLHREWYGLK